VSFPRDGLAQLLGQLAGLQCTWKGTKAPQQGRTGLAKAWLELTMGSARSVGQDEQRESVNPNNPNAYDPYIVGYRLVIVSVRCRSDDAHDQPDDRLEKVRYRLRGPTALFWLQGQKMSFVRAGPTAWYQEPNNDASRARLAAVMDCSFGYLGGGPLDDDPGQTVGEVNSGGPIPGTFT
jgi:hypothetical protein